MAQPTKTAREMGLTVARVIIQVDREEGGGQAVAELVPNCHNIAISQIFLGLKMADREQ